MNTDESRYGWGITDRGDHESTGADVQLSKEVIPLIRGRECIILDVGKEVDQGSLTGRL